MNYNGIEIELERDSVYDQLPMELLKKHYLKNNETSPQQAFARAATNFCYGDYELAQRIYDYVSNQWASFASPVLSNAVTGTWLSPVTEWRNDVDNSTGEYTAIRKAQFQTSDKVSALPISCFLSEVPDTLSGQKDAARELADLSTVGGGVGQYLGMRGVTAKSPGAIPYLKTMDSNILYYHQSGTRRGSVAAYLDISHPDIQEFIGVRTPTGGDVNRKCLNIHNAVNITDDFLHAVKHDLEWNLISPHDGVVVDSVNARELWQQIIETRFKTGEPYLHYVDESNRRMNEGYKKAKKRIKISNLCSEILIPIDQDHTAVCCLSSLNLEKFEEWKDTTIVEDFVKFLDNVLQWFIDYSPVELIKARNGALLGRDIGLGIMGWHNFLMRNKIPFESGGIGSAAQYAYSTTKLIKERAVVASIQLGKDRGLPECNDGKRNATLMALAPNANSSIICQSSASTEPVNANIYVHRTRMGSHVVKNKYLDQLIKEKNLDYEKTWNRVLNNKGSVQGLDEFSEEEQKLFKTFKEIDQRYIIDQARIRQEHVDQTASVNLAFYEGVSKKVVNDVHLRAFSNDPSLPGVPLKTLYYLRASKLQNVESVSGKIVRNALKDFESQEVDKDEEVCISCAA
jgi:ribonucleoside-diphosphate reductase alpha chain